MCIKGLPLRPDMDLSGFRRAELDAILELRGGRCTGCVARADYEAAVRESLRKGTEL